ncbi:hypothetical protein QJ856_gp0758 [Tupanvirus deep ocean]|uniref:Uncharacterized protein n=2 Tax=Tupanvirus TaxID=2094720 RepID=A0AC62A8E6_9VIRU|nr:hypothetical protein QJ856_gp0758 [Tupanvirus deep ocean]QKU33994.1 hypothetical protein [Tupanvirus deep ocean]
MKNSQFTNENITPKKRRIKYKVNNELYNEEDFLKDCPNNKFIPTTLPPVKRIIAIGDIHGDLDLAIKSFKLAKLIDDDFNWIADPPDTVVVQVGDQIDSCRPIPNVYDCHNKKYPEDSADDVNILNFFDKMHEKASNHGGAVYSLLGNHELMNAQGKFQYVSYDNFYNFQYIDDNKNVYQGPNGRKDAFEPGGPLAIKLACTRPSVLIIGSTMFVHAGVLPVLAKRLKHLGFDNETKLKYLNAVVRKWLLHKLSEENDIENQKIFVSNLKESPFWTRIYGSIPENTDLDSSQCFTSVKKALQVYNIGHLVIGHTPQLFTNKNGINGTCYEQSGDKTLYRVDGGFSKAFRVFDNQGLVQVLEIIDDKDFNIITDTSIHEYVKPPDVNINEREMQKISSLYSQNRIEMKPKNKLMKKLIY